MVNVIIASVNKEKVHPWLDALDALYPMVFYENAEQLLSSSETAQQTTLLILDAALISEKYSLADICRLFYKVLVINEDRQPEQKIQYIYDGAWGYSDFLVSQQLIVRAIDSIINNEVWLERQLIPELLKGAIARSNVLQTQGDFDAEELKIFSILTHREVEVIRQVYNGVDNIAIAQALNISNRTVKAHLSAIYRKLDVSDRFQLIIFLKNLHIGRLTNESDFFAMK